MKFLQDARYYQIAFLSTFLFYGITQLGWLPQTEKYFALFIACLGTQVIGNYAFSTPQKNLPSALITTLGLCLLLKTENFYLAFACGFIAIASKFIFKHNGRHFINPANFGLVIVTLLNQQAWISPAQWGFGAMLIFFIGALGSVVSTKAKVIEIALFFLLPYAFLLFVRNVVYLQWPLDFYLQQLSNGGLLLFTFFMITDPASTPPLKIHKRIYAVCVAIVAFYLSTFKFITAAPIYALFIVNAVVGVYYGLSSLYQFLRHQTILKYMKTTILLALLFISAPQFSKGFCGFYVAQTDRKIFNKGSEVIIARDGNKTVITMSNDFNGDVKDFAMVVPVPVVLKESDIKITDQKIFDILNGYSAPRLAEYFDENPCEPKLDYYKSITESAVRKDIVPSNKMAREEKKSTVTIEAKYTIGEYDILVLSAKESDGLKTWLKENGYKIPDNANDVLEPYIKSNTKFFVAKVNLKNNKTQGFNKLRPLQISFESPKYMLPIRLGMANAQEAQDLIIYAFTKTGQVECTNYRTVDIPSNLDMPMLIKNKFSAFYKDLFDKQYRKQGKSVLFKEYAWDLSGSNYMHCDPCTGIIPNGNDLKSAGVWWINNNKWNGYSENVFLTRLHVRYDRAHFPQDLQFQNTGATSNFQARYVLHHKATGDMQCPAAKDYFEELNERNTLEAYNLYKYAGWKSADLYNGSSGFIIQEKKENILKAGITALPLVVVILALITTLLPFKNNR